jgi:anti-sigma-K factor RskA
VSSHQDWEEIAAGHALGALEPDDEQRFEAHLRTCAECAQVIADSREVMAELAVAPDQVTPPPELKARLMAAIHEAADDEPRMAVVSHPDTLEVIRGRRRAGHAARSRATERWVRYAAAASVVLLAVIAAGVWGRGSSTAQPRFVTLASAQAPATQVATVAVLDGKAWTISSGLPANDTTDSQYVLWAVPVTGDPVPLGGFDVTPGHTVAQVGKVTPSLSSVKAFAVSREPGRTLPTKPTTVVAAGPLT